MEYNTVGKGEKRKDAAAKVTGKAKFTADFDMRGMLHVKIFRSTIAHGRVVKLDISEAEKLEGVVKIFTYNDVRDYVYPTAGHPYSLDPAHLDPADRRMLTDRIRLYGDEIAAVAAEDLLTAEKAVRLIKAEYEELPFYLDPEEASSDSAVEIHEGVKNNILGHSSLFLGETDLDEAFKKSDYIFEEVFETPPVQHCQMENQITYAYKDENSRIVVVSSTQIPHIARRILANIFNIPFGKVRVIKPVVGGGFGNKQDLCLEPLAAYLTIALGGRLVMIDLTREECIAYTRTRHGMRQYMKTGVRKDGRITARQLKSYGSGGAYGSHGHSIVAKQGTNFMRTYSAEYASAWEGFTVYTNMSTAGAMRAYGIPQITFAVEAHHDNIAKALSMDPSVFREINLIKEGDKDPLDKVSLESYGLKKCLERAKEYIGWDEKRELYKNQKGDLRRGVGLACFSYATGVWPFALEISGARMVMNQGGTVMLQVGATEIGQGSDTILCQIAAETIGIPYENVLIDPVTDTDTSPFDTGAYASRQSYVSGQAVKIAALEIREKVLKRAADDFNTDASELDIKDGNIIKKDGTVLVPVSEISLESYYEMEHASPIVSDISNTVKNNPLSFGVCAAEVEVDIKTGKVKVLDICNIHDSGKILNRVLAEGQVHGGMSMSLGYAFSEIMLYDPETGRHLNNNLLDYKIPTVMDTPELKADFVEVYEKTAPYGNKSLGEPPTVPPAPALRNAVLHATGVEINKLPMNPQKLFEAFKQEGII